MYVEYCSAFQIASPKRNNFLRTNPALALCDSSADWAVGSQSDVFKYGLYSVGLFVLSPCANRPCYMSCQFCHVFASSLSVAMAWQVSSVPQVFQLTVSDASLWEGSIQKLRDFCPYVMSMSCQCYVSHAYGRCHHCHKRLMLECVLKKGDMEEHALAI
jgi:hypothetical protein